MSIWERPKEFEQNLLIDELLQMGPPFKDKEEKAKEEPAPIQQIENVEPMETCKMCYVFTFKKKTCVDKLV